MQGDYLYTSTYPMLGMWVAIGVGVIIIYVKSGGHIPSPKQSGCSWNPDRSIHALGIRTVQSTLLESGLFNPRSWSPDRSIHALGIRTVQSSLYWWTGIQTIKIYGVCKWGYGETIWLLEAPAGCMAHNPTSTMWSIQTALSTSREEMIG